MKLIISRSLASLAFACLAAAPFAQAQDAGAQYAPLNAQWLRKPSGVEMASAYPKSMGDLGKSFAVLAECQIGSKGALGACEVLKSTVDAPDLKRSISQLGRSFALDTRQMPDLPGKFVILPVVFHSLGDNFSLEAITLGRSEYVVSDRREGASASLPCGGAGGACYLHPFGWEAAPDFGLVSRALLKIGKTEGSTLVGCTADSAGALVKCSRPSDFSAEQNALLQELLGLYRAPPSSTTGVPVRGHQVVFTYDWAAATEIINASALRRPR